MHPFSTPWKHQFCSTSKGFMKAFKAFIKPFELPQNWCFQGVEELRIENEWVNTEKKLVLAWTSTWK